MFKRPLPGLFAASFLGLLAACGSAPHTPVATQADPIDTSAYAPRVDSFVVVLDASSSMQEHFQEIPKLHAAQDLVASFNGAIPALGFEAGLVTFGKDCGSYFGGASATDKYGLSPFQAGDFETALGTIECGAGATPMSEGVDSARELLASEQGPTAVFIVSDFQWLDTAAVEASVAKLKAQHGANLCLHTIKVGDNTTGDALISSITEQAGCDSAASAGDLTSGAAMSAYVTETLMASLQYEKHTVSAMALFDFDSADLREQGKAELHNLDELIKSQGMRVGDIDIIGHTDSMGSEEYNQGLSERRAQAVKDYMASEGIDAAIIDVSGKGESEPVASNDTDEGRAQNRRVEIHVGTSRPK